MNAQPGFAPVYMNKLAAKNAHDGSRAPRTRTATAARGRRG
jgi:hypothetical protein